MSSEGDLEIISGNPCWLEKPPSLALSFVNLPWLLLFREKIENKFHYYDVALLSLDNS